MKYAGASRPPGSRLVVVAVPAPIAPLLLLRLGASGALLLRTLAARRAALAGPTRPRSGSKAARPGSARSTGWTEVARRAARTHARWTGAKASGTSGTPGRSARTSSRRTRSAEAASPRPGRAAKAAGRARPRRFGLRLLDDDRTPLEDTPRELLDRRLGALVSGGLNEGETAWPAGLTIERDANAA